MRAAPTIRCDDGDDPNTTMPKMLANKIWVYSTGASSEAGDLEYARFRKKNAMPPKMPMVASNSHSEPLEGLVQDHGRLTPVTTDVSNGVYRMSDDCVSLADKRRRRIRFSARQRLPINGRTVTGMRPPPRGREIHLRYILA
jgi:hypothetical protein